LRREFFELPAADAERILAASEALE
jgi:hypothetical protein